MRRLAAAELPTVVVARRGDRLEALADELPGLTVCTADLADADDLERVAGIVASAEAPVDLVVNNAGFGTSGAMHELDVERLQREIAVNVMALTRLSHAALRAMIARRRGWLLNVGSVAGFQPAPRLAVYSATKAYVNHLSESLHEEAKGAGVKVTALCPGLTKTEFQAISNTESYQSKYPRWVWMTADDVAAAALRDVVRGRALSVPGGIYKAISFASAVTPRAVLRRVAGLVQRD